MEVKFRALDKSEIEVRVARCIKNAKFEGVQLLLYKNARTDMDLLDETVGAMNWKREHSRDNANCTISIWDSDKKEWIGKEDTGTESFTEKEKGLASDSFKRAGTNWGIGRELYTAPNIIARAELAKDDKGRYVLPSKFGFIVSKILTSERKTIELLEITLTEYDKPKEVVFKYYGNIPKSSNDSGTTAKTASKTPVNATTDKQTAKQTETAQNGDKTAKQKESARPSVHTCAQCGDTAKMKDSDGKWFCSNECFTLFYQEE